VEERQDCGESVSDDQGNYCVNFAGPLSLPEFLRKPVALRRIPDVCRSRSTQGSWQSVPPCRPGLPILSTRAGSGCETASPVLRLVEPTASCPPARATCCRGSGSYGALDRSMAKSTNTSRSQTPRSATMAMTGSVGVDDTALGYGHLVARGLSDSTPFGPGHFSHAASGGTPLTRQSAFRRSSFLRRSCDDPEKDSAASRGQKTTESCVAAASSPTPPVRHRILLVLPVPTFVPTLSARHAKSRRTGCG
jgi:hypothetical protein